MESACPQCHTLFAIPTRMGGDAGLVPILLPCNHNLCRNCVATSVMIHDNCVVCVACGASFEHDERAGEFGEVNEHLSLQIAAMYTLGADCEQAAAPPVVAPHASRTRAPAPAPGPHVDEHAPGPGATALRDSVTDCRYHLVGHCKNGPRCAFRHHTGDPSYCASWSSGAATTRASVCPAGASCSHGHPHRAVMAATDCPRFLNKTAFCDARTCRMRHMEALRKEVEHAQGMRRPSPVLQLCSDWAVAACHNAACPYIHVQDPLQPLSHDYAFLAPCIATHAQRTAAAEAAAAAAAAAAIPATMMPAWTARPPAAVMLSAPEAAAASAPGGRQGGRVITLWDAENCTLEARRPADVIANIRAALIAAGILRERSDLNMKAFYNARLENEFAIPGAIVTQLGELGVTMIDVGIKRGAADHRLKDAVTRTLEDAREGLRIAAIVIITGDADFAIDLNSIKRCEPPIRAILIAGDRAKDTLLMAAGEYLLWKEILAGNARMYKYGGAPPIAPAASAAAARFQPRDARPVCAFFERNGTCTYGRGCKFSHDVGGHVETAHASVIDHTKRCQQYIRGVCTYGNSCKDVHDLDVAFVSSFADAHGSRATTSAPAPSASTRPSISGHAAGVSAKNPHPFVWHAVPSIAVAPRLVAPPTAPLAPLASAAHVLGPAAGAPLHVAPATAHRAPHILAAPVAARPVPFQAAPPKAAAVGTHHATARPAVHSRPAESAPRHKVSIPSDRGGHSKRGHAASGRPALAPRHRAAPAPVPGEGDVDDMLSSSVPAASGTTDADLDAMLQAFEPTKQNACRALARAVRVCLFGSVAKDVGFDTPHLRHVVKELEHLLDDVPKLFDMIADEASFSTLVTHAEWAVNARARMRDEVDGENDDIAASIPSTPQAPAGVPTVSTRHGTAGWSAPVKAATIASTVVTSTAQLPYYSITDSQLRAAEAAAAEEGTSVDAAAALQLAASMAGKKGRKARAAERRALSASTPLSNDVNPFTVIAENDSDSEHEPQHARPSVSGRHTTPAVATTAVAPAAAAAPAIPTMPVFAAFGSAVAPADDVPATDAAAAQTASEQAQDTVSGEEVEGDECDESDAGGDMVAAESTVLPTSGFANAAVEGDDDDGEAEEESDDGGDNWLCTCGQENTLSVLSCVGCGTMKPLWW